jgi:hypothetical protein
MLKFSPAVRAERARTCGYPERFAQEALGHQSKAVHRAYAKKAQVVISTLEDYERRAAADSVIVPLPLAALTVNQRPASGARQFRLLRLLVRIVLDSPRWPPIMSP